MVCTAETDTLCVVYSRNACTQGILRSLPDPLPLSSTLHKIITYHSGNHCSNQRRGRLSSHGATFRLNLVRRRNLDVLSHTSEGERISIDSAIRERDSWEESTDGAKALEQGAVTYRAGTTPSFVFVYSG